MTHLMRCHLIAGNDRQVDLQVITFCLPCLFEKSLVKNMTQLAIAWQFMTVDYALDA